MLDPYTSKVRALDVVIGQLDGELRKAGYGGGTLGNFVTDGMRAEGRAKLGIPIDLAVSNSGGLRKNAFTPGDLRVRDIYELLPFENALIEVELTGAQVLRVLQIALENREPQSGARIRYKVNEETKKAEMISAVLIDPGGRDRPIDPSAKYRIITIDYLLSVAGGKFAILQESKVQKPLGLTIRDALIDYIKSETAAGRTIKARLDGRFRLEGPGGVREP
ncbi:MAG TPA: 5'-nucleotidase [Pyrinomonadaceae bacterium]|jgi:2',3'-cyclic-nucleotide 2'-phosphodiesterase (5'-nucleotidase family)|nr:5'-nucleotidase [Pyrinomonadaceae bacterium]